MAPKYMTVVIQMPDNQEQRGKIIDAVGLGKTFHGGVVTAASSEDEISKVEKYEAELDGWDPSPGHESAGG